MVSGIKTKCDFCNEKAKYDGKTKMGPWAFMCEAHFSKFGVKEEGMYSLLKETIEPTKVCSICGQEKPISDYYEYVDNKGRNRLRTECKQCNLQNRKEADIRKTHNHNH